MIKQCTKGNGPLLLLLFDPSQKLLKTTVGNFLSQKYVLHITTAEVKQGTGGGIHQRVPLLPAWILTHNLQLQDKCKLVLICSDCFGSAGALCFSHISHQ